MLADKKTIRSEIAGLRPGLRPATRLNHQSMPSSFHSHKVLWAAALVGISCQPTEGTFLVKVLPKPDTKSRCIKVAVSRPSRPDEAPILTGPMRRPDDPEKPLLVAVYQGDLEEEVPVWALGYEQYGEAGEGCVDLTNPPEHSERQTGKFEHLSAGEQSRSLVELTLAVEWPSDGGEDGGPDASFDTDGGRVDGGDGGQEGRDGGYDGGGDGGTDGGGDAGSDAGILCGGVLRCQPGDYCNGLTECVPDFDYTPSNFDNEMLDLVTSKADLEIKCDTTIDTQSDLAVDSVVVTAPCGGPLMRPVKAITMDGGRSAVVWHAKSFSVNQGVTLTVQGGRPLIIVVRENATIDGTIVTYAGADRDCAQPPNGRTFEGNTVGGGGGGGFGDGGSPGGGANAGVGQGANGNERLTPLRGGCRGGSGGSGDGTKRADGGFGGGALQMSAVGNVTINGIVSGPGGGGLASIEKSSGGGGAGGSGGALLIEGRVIILGADGGLTVNGGGGAGGATGSALAEPGCSGLLDSDLQASGGDGGLGTTNHRGGSGGLGGARLGGSTAGQASPDERGGGGGGGAVGRIRLNASDHCEKKTGHLVSGAMTGSGSDCGI